MWQRRKWQQRLPQKESMWGVMGAGDPYRVAAGGDYMDRLGRVELQILDDGRRGAATPELVAWRGGCSERAELEAMLPLPMTLPPQGPPSVMTLTSRLWTSQEVSLCPDLSPRIRQALLTRRSKNTGDQDLTACHHVDQFAEVTL